MSSPPNNSEEFMDDCVNIFEEPSSSDEEIVYGFHTYTRELPIKENKDILDFEVRLPQKHSLWAHLPWNAGIVLSSYLDQNVDFKDKTVLELGSGAGLPCFIAALNNAKRVVMTDYPEDTLIENLKYNRNNSLPIHITTDNKLMAIPHLWGKNPEELNQLLDNPSHKYDIIILSDLIFNHAVHNQMLTTCCACLNDDGIIYVTFSHHRPNRKEKDLYFFELAAQEPYNLESEKFKEVKMKAMFEHDLGCEETRSMVHFYTMKKKK